MAGLCPDASMSNMTNKQRSFALYNFGCKVNQEEGGALAALFIEKGWQQDESNPHLIVINTCTVTAIADKKARNLIRRLRREHRDTILAVCGCYAQRAAEEISSIAEIEIIVGVDERQRLPQLVEEYLLQQEQIICVSPIQEATSFKHISEMSLQKRARAYLKIEDGCDQFCTYCIIPHVRGPIRSLAMADAVSQARKLLQQGHKEIVLSGIHIGAYGSDLPKEEHLPQLIRNLLALPGLSRLRLGSIEPQQFDIELMQLIGQEPRICPHLHIPLQSGSDRILTLMGRHYDTQAYAELIAELRARREGIAFTTDLIVGFPGESEADFAATCQLLEKLDLADMHIFPYSRRSGTPAAEMAGQLSQALKAKRAEIVSQLAARKTQEYASSFIGKTLDLLPEEIVSIEGKRYLSGHSNNYLPLLLEWQEDNLPQDILLCYAKQVAGKGLLVDLCQ